MLSLGKTGLATVEEASCAKTGKEGKGHSVRGRTRSSGLWGVAAESEAEAMRPERRAQPIWEGLILQTEGSHETLGPSGCHV